jgi:hypothetical protein
MNKRTFLITGLLRVAAIMLTKANEALEFYLRASDKKWAVICSI